MQGRFFFGFSIVAPWDEKEPQGRMIPPQTRHITTHFVGNIERESIDAVLPKISIDPFYLSGVLDSLIFLPVHFPKNVSAIIAVDTGKEELQSLYKEVGTLLHSHKLIAPPKRPLLPHTSFCRGPYNVREWKKYFHQLPCFAPYFACFESDGNLTYKVYKSWPLKVPFETLDHPADHPTDIAYRVHGRNFLEIFYHACIAISFFHPPFSGRIPTTAPKLEDVDQVIHELNILIKGSPIKAVSRRGELKNEAWEMIVAV